MRWLSATPQRARALFFLHWIALTLIGWLAYSLFRALWAIIGLGAPVYDWLWYIPVILLLTGLPLYSAWHGPIRRAGRGRLLFFATLLFAFALAGCNGFGQVTTIDGIQRDYALPIGVTATWQQVVDRLDGDDDLARLRRNPVDPPGDWAFVNLMVYSSYLPASWRAYYVYLHERAMMRLYPMGGGSYLIGLIGEGMPGEPLIDFDTLVRDARLSRALGAREVVVFQLEGALRVEGQGFVRRLTEAVNGAASGETVQIPFSRPASLVFYSVVLADAMLDIRHQWLWWAGWAALCSFLVLRLTRTK